MFSNICGLALLAVILPGLGSAGVVSQRASNLICGKKGYDRGNGNTFYDDSKKINTYAACSAKCAGNSSCASFGVGEACMLFDIPLNNNFDAASGSSDTYYDKACLSLSTTTSTTSTTSKTSSSATTTPTSSSKVTTSWTSTSAPSTPTTTSSKATTSSNSKASSITAALSSNTASASAQTATISSNTSAASSSTTSASSTATVPSGCPAPTAVQITGLSWFNSTHNLDCPAPNYPPNSQVCWNDKHVCVDESDGVPGGPRACACTPFCYTGLPQHAYQPLGYGPPDNVTVTLGDEFSCTAVMPTGFRDFEIGTGHVNCGNAQDTLEFYGDSNKNFGNNGSVYYTGFVYNSISACQGRTPRYGGNFPLSCTRDSGGNATCGLARGSPVTLPLLSFD